MTEEIELEDPEEVSISAAYAKPRNGVVDRKMAIREDLWAQILELSTHSGINFMELVNRLLEDGIARHVRAPVEKAWPKQEPAPPPEPPWMVVYVEEGDELLGRLRLRQVPSVDEVMTIDGQSYLVLQRAWTVKEGNAAAYLRVRAYEGS